MKVQFPTFPGLAFVSLLLAICLWVYVTMEKEKIKTQEGDNFSSSFQQRDR